MATPRSAELASLYRRAVDEPKALDEIGREVGSASGTIIAATRGIGDEALFRVQTLDGRVWRIGTQASTWVLASREAVFNGADAAPDDMESALGGLVGVRLERLEVTRAWALVLVLEGDRWLEVEAALHDPDPAGDDPPYWEVICPDGTLIAVGPGPWWRITPSRGVGNNAPQGHSAWPATSPASPMGTQPLAERELSELLTLWTQLTSELEKRGAIRRNAQMLGDMAEELVRHHYGGFRGSYEQSGWDVLAKDGSRLEVKAISGERAMGRRVRVGPDDYDAIVLVAFADQLLTPTAWHIPRDVVLRHQTSVRNHDRRRFLRVTRALLADPEVQRVELAVPSD